MKNRSIKFKLIALAVFMQVVTLIVGLVGSTYLAQVVKEYNTVARVSYPNTSAVLEMLTHLRMARIQIMYLGLPSTTKENAQKAIDVYNSEWSYSAEVEKKYLEQPFQPGEEELFKEFKKSSETLKSQSDQAIALYHKNSDPNSKEREEMLRLMDHELVISAKILGDNIENLKKFHFDLATQNIETAESKASLAKNISIGIIVVGILLGMAISYMLAQSISTQLIRIGNSLNDSSSQVSQASSQIAASSEELSQSSTEQAASLEQTAASIEEISSMVAKSSENSRKSSEEALTSKERAEDGQNAVREMINSISEISRSNDEVVTQIDHSNQELESIVKVIEEIGSKTKVINEIVFQTKLLSFNASVEAARAGEQGKGFAVVAEEVGNLAQMSGKAAKEISDLLDNSTTKVKTIISESKNKISNIIEDGKEKINTGNEVAQRCSEILESIVNSVNSVTDMSKEISVASEEQTRGIQEITKAMSQLDQTTQSNSATSEETASAAEELSAQSQSLKDLVGQLQAIVNGHSGGDFSSTPSEVPAKSGQLSNIVNFRKKEKTAAPPSAAANPQKVTKPFAIKKVANGEHVPSYDDPGFNE